MPKFHILEVLSGLGMGGAEKAFLGRIKYRPHSLEHSFLNIRPEIDGLASEIQLNIHKIESWGIFRLLETVKFIRGGLFDAVIVRTPLDVVRFALVKLISKKRVPRLIFEAHSNFGTKKFGLNTLLILMIRLISQEIDLTIAVSENVKQSSLCRYQKNVHVVYLGSDLKVSQLSETTSTYPQLLFVSRLIELKRPIWFLERIVSMNAKFELPNAFLTIVGTGPLEDDLKKFIDKNNLQKIVNFVGFQANVAPFYASATHLISCSTNEGLPLTFFEAKLSGLSILATPSGGGSEIFGEEDHELESFDEIEFESALEAILHAPSPSIQARKSIQLKSQWMSAQSGSELYYSLISKLLTK